MGKTSSKLSAESLEKLKHHHHNHHHSGDDYGASSSGSGGGRGVGDSDIGAGPGCNRIGIGSTCKLSSPSAPLPNNKLATQSSMSPPSISHATTTTNANKYLRKGLSLDQMPADAKLNGILDDEATFVKFLTDIFGQEVELTDSMQTLFRGNCVASKIMSYCFKTFGSKYLKDLLEPHIPSSQLNISYEIDSSKLEEDGDIEVNQRNLLKLTKQILDSILSSSGDFPPQLNLMCICLRKVLCKKYPYSDTYLKAVGTVIFLRFINPAIVSPYESGIVDKPPPPKIMRGLMLVSKILQNIANNVEFAKEEHMLPINDFVKAHIEPMRQWVAKISNQTE